MGLDKSLILNFGRTCPLVERPFLIYRTELVPL